MLCLPTFSTSAMVTLAEKSRFFFAREATAVLRSTLSVTVEPALRMSFVALLRALGILFTAVSKAELADWMPVAEIEKSI